MAAGIGQPSVATTDRLTAIANRQSRTGALTPHTRTRPREPVMCWLTAMRPQDRRPSRLPTEQRSCSAGLYQQGIRGQRRSAFPIADVVGPNDPKHSLTSVSAGQLWCGAPAGIEPATPSLPCIPGPPPCDPAFSQVTIIRNRHSYGVAAVVLRDQSSRSIPGRPRAGAQLRDYAAAGLDGYARRTVVIGCLLGWGGRVGRGRRWFPG